MTELVWAIKSTLVSYVRGMSDGVIIASGGATEDATAFRYPAASGLTDEDLRFDGTVSMRGHGGMMHLTFAAPWLNRETAGWILSISDPDDIDARLAFATVRELVSEGTVRRGSGVALTAQGADLFFGPYRADTPLDDFLLEG